MSIGPSIFFYDGECGVCDATVDFLLRNSPADCLHFAPLQSGFAHRILSMHGVAQPNLTTAYFFDGTRVHEKSGAVLGALKLCTGWVKHLSTLRFIPMAVRDLGYDVFSLNRHRILEKNQQSCRLLNETERLRFHE